jgi:hypothetical protein
MNQMPDRSKPRLTDFGVVNKLRPAATTPKPVDITKTPTSSKRLRRPQWLTRFRLVLAWAIIATIACGVLAATTVSQRKEISMLKSNQAVDDETAKLIARVASLVSLPEGETPTIATVTDVEKLRTQTFFAKAENGDRVLIFSKARKAYLYRPSTNKIVEIGPINIGSGGAGTATTPTGTTSQ